MICFVLDILVYLLQAPRLTEFNGLVRLLTDYDLAGGRSVTDKVKDGLLGSDEKRLHTFWYTFLSPQTDQVQWTCYTPHGL